MRIREAQYGQFNEQINNFARASYCFMNISLPPLHDHDVKMPNFTFYCGRKQTEIKFFPL